MLTYHIPADPLTYNISDEAATYHLIC